MTQDEIIAMAKEAGMVTGPNLLFSEGQRYRSLGAPRNIKERHLLRFAALVEAKAAAKEREACAQSLENLVADHVAGTRKSKNKMDWCAADDRSCEYVAAWSEGAAAIRARGNT